MRSSPLTFCFAAALLFVGPTGCDDGAHDEGRSALDGSPTDAPGGGEDAATGEGGRPLPALASPPIEAHLTFSGRGGHLFSFDLEQQELRRLTAQAGPYTYHAVSPDGQKVAAVRQEGERPGSVWIIELAQQRLHRVSPEGCDAGIGGVSWYNDAQIVYAAACGGEASAAYLVDATQAEPAREALLQLSDHEQPVRAVFAATRLPFFSYVLDVTSCAQGQCVTKPEIWVAQMQGNRCRLTDGDRALVVGAERLGDHRPTFSPALDQVYFSRNVEAAPQGPEGRFQLMRVGLNLSALMGGQANCAVGAVENLSETLLESQDYPDAQGQLQRGSERDPAASAGRGPQGALLYVAERGEQGTPAGLWLMDEGGQRTLLSPDDLRAAHPAWVIPAYRNP